jgi:hypothetical protein
VPTGDDHRLGPTGAGAVERCPEALDLRSAGRQAGAEVARFPWTRRSIPVVTTDSSLQHDP